MNCLITINRHTIAALSLFFLLNLAACGDSSSSSESINEDYTEDDSSENDDTVLDSKEYTDSSAIGTAINSGMGTTSITKDSIYGYKTIRFGAYEWMAENVEEYVGTSTCYNDNEKNCNAYGSLFLNRVSNSACPYGFHLPTVDDFKYLVKFAGDVTSKKFGFNPQYAGICRDMGKTIKCSDIGKALNLMSSEHSYFHLSSSGNVVYAEMKDDEYYSVRCVKSSGFVDNEKFLPTCNFQWEDEVMFVSSEKTNYVCQNEEWVKDSSDKCDYTKFGQKHYIGDTLYICDGRWRPAELRDLDEPCSAANEWEVLKLNGKNYVCEDTTWRRVEWLENHIGFCKPDSIGKIDSILSIDSVMTPYYCAVNGWREALLPDILGVCDSTKIYETGKFKRTNYICRYESSWGLQWDTYSDLEEKIGVCVPKNNGARDTLINAPDTTIYVCDNTKWREAEPKDIYGDCDKSRVSESVKFKRITYVCRDNQKWLAIVNDEVSYGICTSVQLGKRDTIYASWIKDYIYYVCDTTTAGSNYPAAWRKAGIEDYYECNESNMYKVIPFTQKKTYGCNKKLQWEEVSYPVTDIGYCYEEIKNTIKVTSSNYSYICDSVWREATIDEGLGVCSAARERERAIFDQTYYACQKGSWEKINKIDYYLGICDSLTLQQVALNEDSVHYVCKAKGWTAAYAEDIFGKCEETNYGRIVEYRSEKGDIVKRICRNKSQGWGVLSDIETLRGFCSPSREGDTLVYKDTVYKCSAYTWQKVPLDTTLGKCTSATYGNTGTIGTKKYICSANGWELYSAVMDALGVCEKSIQGTIKTYNGKKYGCGYSNENSHNKYEWVEESEITDSLGFCLGDKFEWKIYKGKDYSCRYGRVAWENSTFWSMYLSCNESTYGITVGYEGQHYYCDESLPDSSGSKNGWHAVTPMDSTIGICRKDIYLEPATYLGEHYYCGTVKECARYRYNCYTWLEATSLEQINGQCDSKREGAKGKYNGMNFVCEKGSWKRDPADYTTQKDPRSGQVFRSVKIGNHTWMADNLNYPVSEHSWCPNNISKNCDTYGRLYTWAVAMDVNLSYEKKTLSYSDSLSHQGICPDGWRIPATSEWKDLSQALNRDLGFSQTPAGYHHVWLRNGIDHAEEYIASDTVSMYWSSSQANDSLAFLFSISNKYNSQFPKAKKENGYSVRCIKDE